MTAIERRLMPFPEDRVLEDAAFVQGMVPERLFALLLPIWEVEIRADVTQGEDFALIDRFLERGLHYGELHTVGELAAFYALDESLTAQAVRFLTAIGHVEEYDGRLSLTPLGKRSVEDDIRYMVTRQDRRKLYFEALACTPLTRDHYDADVVTMLSGDKLEAALDRSRYPRFTPVQMTSGFDRKALDRLNARTDRARYNLPARLDAMESLGEELVFLPVYLVRGRGSGLLVYGQAGAGSAPDPGLSELCARTPELTSALENEARADATDEYVRRAARKWLDGWKMHTVAPHQDEDGTWSVPLPRGAFGEKGLHLIRIGTYQMAGSRFFRVWCEDEALRKHALLQRLDQRLGSRRRVSPESVEELVARLSRQLRLEPPPLAQLRNGAAKAGLTSLEAQLTRLEKMQK